MRDGTKGGNPASVFPYDIDLELHDAIAGTQHSDAIEQKQVGHSQRKIAPLPVGNDVIAATK
jgi:hypothetical protein